MVEVARTRVGGRARIELGNLLAFAPPQPVAATTCFRSLHFVDDRAAWFLHLASFTERKLVFDFSPRRVPPATVRAELAAAGFTRVELRPFFVPQHRRLPLALAVALELAGRVPPLAHLLLRRNFPLIAAAWRG
jgi:hypothetical protein